MFFPGNVQGDAIDGFATDQWDGGRMKLFKNDMEPADGTVVGDFEEADFSGYAESAALTSGDPFQGADGEWKELSQRVQFDHNGGPVANTIYGFYVVKGVAPALELVAAHRFSPPRGMSSVADAISLVVGLKAALAGEVFMQG